MGSFYKNRYSFRWVPVLVYINVIVYLLQYLAAALTGSDLITMYLSLRPTDIAGRFWIWQIFTYMFLHSIEMPLHIFFNMYILWVFGLAVEEEWGPASFLKYYFFTGIGAGISIFVFNYFTMPFIPTIGASGAVLGVLLAFGILYPNAELLLFFILPVRAKYLVTVYALIEFYFLVANPYSQISHIGHVGGVLFGIIYFLLFKREYIFRKRQVKTNRELLMEIKQRMEAIQDHTLSLRRQQKLSQAMIVKKKIKLKEPETEDRLFLENLIRNKDRQSILSICEAFDFHPEDEYCRQCDYFEICLYRDISGKDPRMDL